MAEYFAGFDIGTNGTKAVLCDAEGKVVGTSFRPYSVVTPRPGWNEQDPKVWLRAIEMTVKELLSKTRIAARNISSLAICAQTNTLVPIDRSGKPLCNSITTMDLRSAAEAEYVGEQIGKAPYYFLTGSNAIPQLGLPKILWLRKRARRIFERTWKFLDCKDYIEYVLTGKIATDQSCGSFTGMMHLRKKKWVSELLREFQLDECVFPDILDPKAIVGCLQDRIAQKIGLKTSTLVVVGGSDVASAGIGAGASIGSKIHLCIGTSGWLGVPLRKLEQDRKRRLRYICHNDSNQWMIMAETDAAGGCLQWIASLFPSAKKGVSRFSQIDQAAEKSTPGSNGVIFSPHLWGGDTDRPLRLTSGALLGLRIDHTWNDIARSVLEGVAFRIRSIGMTLQESHHLNPSRIKFVGGGAKSHLWVRIFADVLRKKIVVPKNPQYAGARGAAIIGAIGLRRIGSFEECDRLFTPDWFLMPNKVNVRVYGKTYETYCRLERLINGTVDFSQDIHN